MPIKVLLIDDEPLLRDMLKRGLETIGNYEVALAASGPEGIRMAKRLKPDAVLLDVDMPQMTGFEVLRTLKSHASTWEIPVLMLSGLTDVDTKTECNYEYSEEFIDKPVELALLNERIQVVLRRTGKLKTPPISFSP